MMKRLRKILSIIVFFSFATLALFILSQFLLNNKINSTDSGVALNAIEFSDRTETGKYFIGDNDIYIVYGKYLKTNSKKNYIALLGKNAQIWKINYEDDVNFMYQNPYQDKSTKEWHVYSFKYGSEKMFTKDVFIGKMIMVECIDKYCENAKGISIYDSSGKYAKYRN